MKGIKEAGLAVEHVVGVLGRVFGEVVMVECHISPSQDEKIGGLLNKGWKEQECKRAGMEEWAVEGMKGWNGLWCEGGLTFPFMLFPSCWVHMGDGTC